MAPKSQEIEAIQGKSLTNQDGEITKLIEWATESAASPAEIMDMFLEQDVYFSSGEELHGDYVLVGADDKAEWCNKHIKTQLFCVQWRFTDGDQGEFASVHIISAFGKFIVNDSAKGGMYGQLKTVTKNRENSDDPRKKRSSHAGLNCPRGLRANKPFEYSTVTKKAIPADELDNFDLHPRDTRKMSQPTWSFA